MDYWTLFNGSSGKMFMETFSGVSNIHVTDNPPFTQEDFTEIFPVFPISDEYDPKTPSIPQPFFNVVLAMTNAAIKETRYHTSWRYMMCLYMAHFFTLFLQTQSGEPGAASALSSALPTGVTASKSVKDLSVSYTFMGLETDFNGYGTWKLTKYGQQLVTMAKMYGMAGMWANG